MPALLLECPCCWGEVPVTDGVATATCPDCKTVWSVEFDGDMDAEGRQRDASYLHSPVIVGCTVHRLRGGSAYRVTFADRSHSNIRYTSGRWEADRWRDGVQERATRGGYASLTDAIAAVTPRVETCSGCGYCEPDKNLHCPRCCSEGMPF